MKECVTHHYACDCREQAHFREVQELKKEKAELQEKLEAAQWFEYDSAYQFEGEIKRLSLDLDMATAALAEISKQCWRDEGSEDRIPWAWWGVAQIARATLRALGEDA